MAGELIAQLSAEDEAERAYAAEDLGCADDGTALDALIMRLDVEPSQHVREAIVTALEHLTDARVPGRMIGLFSHTDAFVRNSAVGILQGKGPAALPALKQALSGGEDGRRLALDALAAIEAPGVHELYEQALDDDHINVRISAVEGVGDHRVMRLCGRLEELFAHEDNAMMLTALYTALLVVGTEVTGAVIFLRHPTLESVPAYQRSLWLRALARWGPASSIDVVTEAALDPAVEGVDVFEAAKSLDERFHYRRMPSRLIEHLKSLSLDEAAPALHYHLVEWMARTPSFAPESSGGGDR